MDDHEAEAFVASLRLTLTGRVGFRWLDEKLIALAEHIAGQAVERRAMDAYLDERALREDFETWRASRPGKEDS